jgi:hypothetical protein
MNQHHFAECSNDIWNDQISSQYIKAFLLFSFPPQKHYVMHGKALMEGEA